MDVVCFGSSVAHVLILCVTFNQLMITEWTVFLAVLSYLFFYLRYCNFLYFFKLLPHKLHLLFKQISATGLSFSLQHY